MGEDFSGIVASPGSAASAWLGAAFIALIGAVTAIVVLVVASFLTGVVGTGHLFCPDGGDEIWHRPSTSVLVPELLTGVVITIATALGIGAILRGRRIHGAFRIGTLLGLLSAGAVTYHVVAGDYLSITGQPARYRCGSFTPTTQSVPGWTTVLLIAAFPLVLALLAATSRQEPLGQ